MSRTADLREQAVEYLAGHTIKETTEAFGVSSATLQNWRKLKLETGGHEDREHRPRPRKIPPEKLRALVDEHPDWYQRELAEMFGCTAAAISKVMRRMRYSRKKKRHLRRAVAGEGGRVPSRNSGR